jgi:hypothetical protein
VNWHQLTPCPYPKPRLVEYVQTTAPRSNQRAVMLGSHTPITRSADWMPIDALNGDHVAVDHVHDLVSTGAEPVIAAAVESIRWRRAGIVGQRRDRDADRPGLCFVCSVSVPEGEFHEIAALLSLARHAGEPSMRNTPKGE